MFRDVIPVAFHLVGAPAIYLFWIWWLYAANKRTGIRISVILFALSYAAGAWRLIHSGMAAAPLRLLLLPYDATVAGLLGLAFAYGWASKSTAGRIGGRLCLTAAALLIGAQLLT